MSNAQFNGKYSRGSTEDDEDIEDPSHAETFEIISSKDKHLLHRNYGHSNRYLGYHYPVLWGKAEPKFTVGPHCK